MTGQRDPAVLLRLVGLLLGLLALLQFAVRVFRVNVVLVGGFWLGLLLDFFRLIRVHRVKVVATIDGATEVGAITSGRHVLAQEVLQERVHRSPLVG